MLLDKPCRNTQIGKLAFHKPKLGAASVNGDAGHGSGAAKVCLRDFSPRPELAASQRDERYSGISKDNRRVEDPCNDDPRADAKQGEARHGEIGGQQNDHAASGDGASNDSWADRASTA
jgi:hypothetical protein